MKNPVVTKLSQVGSIRATGDKIIFQLNVQCIFNVLLGYGLDCNDINININIIIIIRATWINKFGKKKKN